ncbi:MAG TPA: SDR family NAD(P)-dependent oxidoreductase [Pseudonocardiaceae bacterium]
MTTTFITGANRGLGYETARRLIQLGHDVIVGARDPRKGQAAADTLGARYVRIEVSDEASVSAAAAAVRERFGRIDVLVNNAGIDGGHQPISEVSAEDLRRVFDVNVLGLARVTRAFLPLLARSENPRIVNVGSGVGSFAYQHSEGWGLDTVDPVYSTSKAAVSMLTVHYARSLPGFQVNAANPGYTDTDLTGHLGTQTVEEGTDAIVRLATLRPGELTGAFVQREGVTPW